MDRNHAARWTACLALAWTTGAPAAELVEISWTPAGRFERTVAVPAGGFAEVCGNLAKGARVRWDFVADVAMAFNIHYHVGKDVVYPERREGVARLSGELVAPVDQDYCWMWSNKSKSDAQAALTLQR